VKREAERIAKEAGKAI
jgi:hypothetical protein